ncbi:MULTISPECIES: nuclear transport factor 2 family protein [Streptomyces]|uniref:nuclear transport factor 2 family protein n=1 Tax=Streptomyces TaxID=1883 RepID=UPI0018DFF31F|nr:MULTISPECIES: nuclear transport factor 2 family protein [Streptomyces]MCZ4102800.1 nuclear transport factor 2 family protein [Streptomyces sp. H39-C1]
MGETAQTIAARLQEAFEAGDLAQLGTLLDPGVRWGGKEDTPQTCHSCSDVLVWYGRLSAEGVRSRITETIVRDEAVVLGFDLAGPERGPDGERPNQIFQVFRLSGGPVTDIRGYPQRALALAVADVPAPTRG